MISVLLLFLSLPPEKTLAEQVEKIYAQTALEIITQSDIKKFRALISKKLLPPSLLLNEVYGKSQLLKNKKELIDFLTLRYKLYQMAQKKQLPEISEKRIKKTMAQIKGSSSSKRFQQKLRQAGVENGFLRKQIGIDLAVEALLLQSVVSKISVSEEEMEFHYFNTKGRTLFKNFEYEFASLSFSEKEKPAVLKMLSSGTRDLKSLSHALKLESKKFHLKDVEIQEIFKKELEKLSISQMSPVISAGANYYILELKWKKPVVPPGEEQKRARLESQLLKSKIKKGLQQWIKEQRKNLLIVSPFL